MNSSASQTPLPKGLPEAPPRNCPAGSPAITRCRLLPSDFASIAALGANQLHAEDPASSSYATGPFSGLYVMAFVPTDEPIEFRTTAGKFVPALDAPVLDPSKVTDDFVCNGQFDDCNNDGLSLKHVVVAPLGGYGAALGPGRVTVSQGAKNASLDFTVVGEPDSAQIDAYRTSIGNGVGDIENNFGSPAPDGKLTGPDECPLPTTEAALQLALTKPDRTVLIARVRDADGTPVSQAWLYWSGTGVSQDVPIGLVGHFGAPITPTYDLGVFGIGAPQVLCGTNGTGTIHAKAEIFRYATGSPASPALPVDTAAHESSATVDIEVSRPGVATSTPYPTDTPTGSPTATPTFTATATPTPFDTPVPTFTPTSTPSNTPAPTDTATATSTPSATWTSTPVPTATATPTATLVGTHALGGVVCRGPYDPNFCEYLYAVPTVTLQPLGWQVTTGYHGNFQFDGVPNGQYTLSLSPSCIANAIGGESCYPQVIVVLSGADVFVTWKPLDDSTPTWTPTPNLNTYTPTPTNTPCPGACPPTATPDCSQQTSPPIAGCPTWTPTPATTRTVAPTQTAAATRTAVATRSPVATRTATPGPGRCADVTGDHRVSWRDVVAEAHAIARHSRDPRFDINGDGRVNVRDLVALVHQLGRRCR